MVALAAALCLVPFDLLIGAYLLLAVNLEAYRFAAGAWSLSVESLATAVVAFRTLLEWGIDPGAKSALKEGRWFAWPSACLCWPARSAPCSRSIRCGAGRRCSVTRPTRWWPSESCARGKETAAAGYAISACSARWSLRLRAAAGLGSQPELRRPGLEAGYAGDLGRPAGPGHPRVNGTLNNANALAMYLLTVAGWALSTSPALWAARGHMSCCWGRPFPSS